MAHGVLQGEGSATHAPRHLRLPLAPPLLLCSYREVASRVRGTFQRQQSLSSQDAAAGAAPAP